MAVTRTFQELYRKTVPCGVWQDGNELVIIFESHKEPCGIIWYDAKGKELERITFQAGDRTGSRYVVTLPLKKYQNARYLFFEGEELVADAYAKELAVPQCYGRQWSMEDLKAGIPTPKFDWGKDCHPRLAYGDSIVYLAHVRGFTAHTSSGVTHPGTFEGIREKLPYLKDLGITTLELQPAYEFPEYPLREEYAQLAKSRYDLPLDGSCPERLLNYWGYKLGYYFLPKKAYSHGNPMKELKELVKALHKNGMELILQFYFPKEVKGRDIPFILQYWVEEYHVDGFHLMGENLPIALIGETASLQDTKFWYHNPVESGLEGTTAYENWAYYNNDYMYPLRKLLRGDEHVLEEALKYMRQLPEGCGRINFLTNYFGLTMMDLVSYDRKHNEVNGEGNRDGGDFNCSWNCGEEGPTRKKKIQQLRERQIKNAMILLFGSQGTPLLFMGDEFGNSQKGNNNPYCQDNEITWLDWKLLEKHGDIHQFCKEMIALRMEHSILHPKEQAAGIDYRCCGYPDLSYHGELAWQPDTMYYNRHIGILYCGQHPVNHKDSVFYYFAMNLHWEEHTLAMPQLPKGWKWQSVTATGEAKADAAGQHILLEGRSICIYKSVKEKKEK